MDTAVVSVAELRVVTVVDCNYEHPKDTTVTTAAVVKYYVRRLLYQNKELTILWLTAAGYFPNMVAVVDYCNYGL